MKKLFLVVFMAVVAIASQAQTKGTDSSVETFSLKNGGHTWTHRYEEGIGQTSIVGGQMHMENFTLQEWIETHCDDLVDTSTDFEVTVNVDKGLVLGDCSVGLIFNSRIYEAINRGTSMGSYDAFFIDGTNACLGHFENGQINNRIFAPVVNSVCDLKKSNNTDLKIGLSYEAGRIDFKINGTTIMSTYNNITTKTIGLILGPSTEVAVFDSINITRKSTK